MFAFSLCKVKEQSTFVSKLSANRLRGGCSILELNNLYLGRKKFGGVK